MTQSLTIRKFGPHEWETYKDLRLRALAESPDAFGTTLEDALKRPDADWPARLATAALYDGDLPLLAEVEGEPAGMLWGRIEESDPGTAHVYQVWVAPAYRGRGIGQRLMEAVIEWARERQVRTVELGVTYRDSPALRLYTRLGFEPVGEPVRLQPGSDLMGLPMCLILRDD